MRRARPRGGVRAVILDLGNVLVGLRTWKMVRALARSSRASTLGVLAAYLARGNGRAYETGGISSRTFYARMRKRVGFRGGYRRFARIWNRMFVRRREMEALLGKLSKHYRVVVLSDTNPLHYRFIRSRFPALAAARRWVVSYRVGARKPHHRMFRRALQAAGVKAGEAFFVDDKGGNVRAARRLGMRAVRYRSFKQVARALARAGVTW